MDSIVYNNKARIIDRVKSLQQILHCDFKKISCLTGRFDKSLVMKLINRVHTTADKRTVLNHIKTADSQLNGVKNEDVDWDWYNERESEYDLEEYLDATAPQDYPDPMPDFVGAGEQGQTFDEKVRDVIVMLHKEKAIKHGYDFHVIQQILEEGYTLHFNNAQSFIRYLQSLDLGIDLPKACSLSKKLSPLVNSYPNWKWKNGPKGYIDLNETNRRINIAKRFLKEMRMKGVADNIKA